MVQGNLRLQGLGWQQCLLAVRSKPEHCSFLGFRRECLVEAATNLGHRVLGEAAFPGAGHQCIVLLSRVPGPDDRDRHLAHIGPWGEPSGAGEPDVGSFGYGRRRAHQEGPGQGTLRHDQ
eukprot:15469660-Alexandrium_andersonii.AAC.1